MISDCYVEISDLGHRRHVTDTQHFQCRNRSAKSISCNNNRHAASQAQRYAALGPENEPKNTLI
jgi:hypothetical protein